MSVRAAVNTCRTPRPAAWAAVATSCPLRNRSKSIDRFQGDRASGMTARYGQPHRRTLRQAEGSEGWVRPRPHLPAGQTVGDAVWSRRW
ncbi:hypothetical protein GCM10017778_31320 [Streptomyces vinaceus]|nr:hypothetical protein GCM10017778_31320 [Streptomyces vinaceus]